MSKTIKGVVEVIVVAFMAAWLFCSCDCYWCNGRGDCKYCSTSHYSSSKTSCNDYFCAETLLGTWQMDYNRIGNIELKQIEFFKNHKCDVTYQEGRDPDWFTDTFTYTYTSGYIKFSNGIMSFSFRVNDFLFPTLYLQDSRGSYTWRKVKSYGC